MWTDRGRVVVVNLIGAALASLVLASGLSINAAQADSSDELSSGPYQSFSAGIGRSLGFQGRVGVSAFSPVIGQGVAGITQEIFFECTAEQGLVSTSDHSQISDFIRTALILELTDAGLFSTESPVSLSGELLDVQLFLDQFAGESDIGGTWKLQLRLASTKGNEAMFSTGHSFPIRDRSRYCQEMAGQFSRSVQLLLEEVLTSERFINLVLSDT